MYVIKRTDKEYGVPTVEHATLIDAQDESKRLAKKHAEENPEFTIYELVKAVTVSSKIEITIIS